MFKSVKGQSMVEMAIILPVLLIILFGIIEFGRILGAYVIIQNLARDGVRAGVVGSTNQQIEDQIIANAVLITIDEEDIEIVPSPDTERSLGGPLRVRIASEMELIIPLLSSIVPNPVKMSAEHVMRIEQLPPD